MISNVIILIKPTKEHAEMVMAYRADFLNDKSFIVGHDTIHGSGSLEKFNDYSEWFSMVTRDMTDAAASQGRMPETQFLAVCAQTGKLVGTVSVRHALNDHLAATVGHIGYSVAPSERGKGYATQMLKLALEYCKALGIDSALLTCKGINIASRKVIEKCGGVYEGVGKWGEDEMLKFWIQT